MLANIYAAWIAMLLGAVAGAFAGLFFHGEAWLGGYGSWRRRMVRLAHISFFGIGLVNLTFAFTARAVGIEDGLTWASRLLIVALAGMPLVCYLSAIRPAFRHLFFIPVGCVMLAIVLLLERLTAS